MPEFIRMLIHPDSRQIPVVGGSLSLPAFDLVVQVALEVTYHHADWEDCDILRASLRLNDRTGRTWEAAGEFFPSAFWLDQNTLGYIGTPGDADEFEPEFAQRCLLHDVYEIRDGRMVESYAMGATIVDVHQKYLACHYDVAYDMEELADGREFAFESLLIRLRAGSQIPYDRIYYRVSLMRALSRSPFMPPWLFRPTEEFGEAQNEVVFRKAPSPA